MLNILPPSPLKNPIISLRVSKDRHMMKRCMCGLVLGLNRVAGKMSPVARRCSHACSGEISTRNGQDQWCDLAYRLHCRSAPLGPTARSQLCPGESIVLVFRHGEIELFFPGIGKMFRNDQNHQVWLRQACKAIIGLIGSSLVTTGRSCSPCSCSSFLPQPVPSV